MFRINKHMHQTMTKYHIPP